MAFKFSDCIKKGLLRKMPPSKEHAEMSFKKAEKWIEESERSLKGNAFDASIISSYLVMFHAGRAILFFDGYREKSHVCIARYLEEKYEKPGILEKKWINLFDHIREMRHSNQYDLGFTATDKEAIEILDISKRFFERMIQLFESLK